MISLAGEPLRTLRCTFGPQPSNSAATTSTAFSAAARKLRASVPAFGRSMVDRSSAKATAASGRMTAITEISVILVGSPNALRCLAAASDCFEPSVATMTCMSDSCSACGLGVPSLSARRAVALAEEVLDQEEHDTDSDETGTPVERRGVVVDHVSEDREVAQEANEQQRRVGTEGALRLVVTAQLETG